MEEKRASEELDIPFVEREAVSWWSWRPGIRPVRAFLFGGLLSLLGLFLLLNGALALIAGILDSTTPPVRVPGVITGHSKDLLGSPQLTLRLRAPGLPPAITLVVSPAASASLPNGAAVTVDYAPHLRSPYALEAGGRRYPLPGTSAFGNPGEALTLLIFGLLILPYPLLLSFWGWRDLHAPSCRATGYVVALRAAAQSTTRTPGMVRRTTRTWYGVAVQTTGVQKAEPEILTFGIRQEIHDRLHRGDKVHITYSPHLHHLYALEQIETE